MGNCVCLSSNGNKPQSKLLPGIVAKKGSLQSTTKMNRATFPTQDSVPIIFNKIKESIDQQSESFYTAYPSRNGGNRETLNSFRGTHTEYMSFDSKEMDMLRSTDLGRLSRKSSRAEILSQSQLQGSRRQSKEVYRHKRSLSQDSLYFSPKEIINELGDSIAFQKFCPSDSYSSETDDGFGFSHMNLKDVLHSKGLNVGYVRDRNGDKSQQTRLALNSLENVDITSDSEGPLRTSIEHEGLLSQRPRSQTYSEHVFTGSNKLTTVAQKGRGRCDNQNLLEKLNSHRQALGRRSSVPSYNIPLNLDANGGSQSRANSYNVLRKRRAPHYHHPKKVNIEPLSPMFNSEESFIHEETKDAYDISSKQDSVKRIEDLQYPNVSKDSEKFIQRGQESLALILRILRTYDLPTGFDRIYKAKNEKHYLTIYFNSFQKPNGQTIIKTFWSWEAPCLADKFIQLNNDIQLKSKMDEFSSHFEEIVEIYSSETESFVLNYQAYKKVPMCKPRDVVYLKHVHKLSKGEWAETSVSVEHEDYPEYKDRLRSEIICAGSLVSNTISDNTCIVKSYSEVDFKANIPAFVAKSFMTASIKDYVASRISILTD